MNSFASEKSTRKKSTLEQKGRDGLNSRMSSPANSELLGSQITPTSPAPIKEESRPLSAGGLSPMSGGSSLFGGPIQAKKPPKISDPVSQDTDGIKLKEGTKDVNFMSTQSRALYEMVKNASPEQLRSDPLLRQMVLDDYKDNMSKRLEQYDGDSYDHMFSSVFRANGVGEMETYNALVRANLPEGMLDTMSGMNDGTQAGVDSSLDFAGQQMQQDPVMSEILMAGMDAFGDSTHFSGENLDRRSPMLMNNVMLRGIAPQFTGRAVEQRKQYARDNGGDELADKRGFDALFDRGAGEGVGKKDIKYSVELQKAVRDNSTSQGGGRFKNLFSGLFRSKRPEQSVDFGSSAPGYGEQGDLGKFWAAKNSGKGKTVIAPEREGLTEYLSGRFADKDIYGDALSQNIQNASGSENIAGLSLSRLMGPLQGSLGTGMSNEQIGDMYENLMAGGRYAELRRQISASKNQLSALPGGSEKAARLQASIDQNQQKIDSYTPQQVADMDERMNTGKIQLKGVYYAQLKRLRDKYGTYGSQLHPDDFMKKVGPEFFDEMSLLQDCEQMMVSSPKSFNFEENEDDREFRTLANYYNDLYGTMNMYATGGFNYEEGSGFNPTEFGMDFLEQSGELKRMLKNEAGVIGPHMDDEQLEEYTQRLQKRMTKGGMANRLFGRFKRH